MILNTTIADIWRPCDKSRALLYDIILISSGSLFIALSAQLAVGWPIPFTMQTFAVLMIGALFGPKRASMTVVLYLLEGLVGYPVFSFGRGGYAIFLGPTGGYLIGFLGAAYVTGLLAQKGWDRRIGTTILAMIIGNIIIYAFGILWLSCLTNTRISLVLVQGVYPYIPCDIIKIIIAAFLLPTGWKLLNYFGFPK